MHSQRQSELALPPRTGGPDNEIPNAVCAASPPANNNNTLAVWTLFSTGWQVEHHDFKGVCHNTTDCESSGSGSGMLPGTTAQLGVAPAQWQLQVTGSAERGTAQQGPRLGGAWILRHRGGGVWDSGDAGPCRPTCPAGPSSTSPKSVFGGLRATALRRTSVRPRPGFPWGPTCSPWSPAPEKTPVCPLL